MPELPEVEVVRRGLEPHLVGRRIHGVEVLDARAIRRHSLGATHLAHALENQRITHVVRRGKFLWLTFANSDDALVMHLGMSGQLRVYGRDRPMSGPTITSEGPASHPRRHERVRIHMDQGLELSFLDQRLFGGIHLSPCEATPDGKAAGQGSDAAMIPRAVAHIARDVLDPHFERDAFIHTARQRSVAIKTLILNQGVVSGIGNIYADEALFATRLHYARESRRLSPRALSSLIDNTRSVMERALLVGGTSFDALYVNVDGRSGYFARSLHVYGREGEPCPRCGRAIRRHAFSGRSSFLCTSCQRK